ncbi:hypothetical protein A6X21_04970 [Planctopirus hydrillae]|uniref:Uncharacterized protein n=1 Tax=Planctopirus hydrillae TaxID=1841610 RepID=A0A1C3EIR8_9PLAN|nr:hypothetical protein [Planctopirus hydrillae]ODA33118.1 hypothetical protein A6X21_04970 [Planctopirus hydrillae]
MPDQAWLISQFAHAMDVFPTALALGGASLPKGVVFDGVDLAPLLFESRPLPERPFFIEAINSSPAAWVNVRLISRLKQVMEAQRPNGTNQNCFFNSVAIPLRNALSPHIPRFSLVFRKPSRLTNQK